MSSNLNGTSLVNTGLIRMAFWEIFLEEHSGKSLAGKDSSILPAWIANYFVGFDSSCCLN